MRKDTSELPWMSVAPLDSAVSWSTQSTQPRTEDQLHHPHLPLHPHLPHQLQRSALTLTLAQLDRLAAARKPFSESACSGPAVLFHKPLAAVTTSTAAHTTTQSVTLHKELADQGRHLRFRQNLQEGPSCFHWLQKGHDRVKRK